MSRVASFCLVLIFVIFSIWTPDSQGARILGLWPMEAPSHFFLGNRLLKELAARGHEVTMISPYPQKTPLKNYRDITITGAKEEMMKAVPPQEGNAKMGLLGLGQMPIWQQMLFTSFVGSKASQIVMEKNEVQKLLKDKNEKFDLIILELFHSEILYGMAHHFDCPVVILSTIGSSTWTNHLVGNPAPSSYVPDLFTKFSGHMIFCERFRNTLVNYFAEIHRKYFYFPEQDKLMHKYFPDAPSLEELMYKKTAMILLNSHPSISEPKPHVPAMVEIGGFHVEPAKPLPKDLKEFMDAAKEGVILFSMGSNLQSTELSEEKRNEILRAFSRLKEKVIWKWEDENLPGKPANVKIMKWCPQSDIMAHPNLKLFVTHGGLLSTTEAVYYGVPVVGIPIFGDQKMNLAMTKNKGFGLGINYEDLSEEKLFSAIQEVLTNPKYRANAKKASELLHDQPVKPLDAAVFWVNHVIKHKGADHLRSAAMDLEWYQIYSLDLIAFVVLVDIVVFYIFYKICKKLCGRKKNEKKVDSKKKKN